MIEVRDLPGGAWQALRRGVSAGFMKLASRVTVPPNIQGDIGKVLREFASGVFVKSLATSMLTAGITGCFGFGPTVALRPPFNV